MKMKLKKALNDTRFADAPMVSFSTIHASGPDSVHVKQLLDAISGNLKLPARILNEISTKENFLFSVDHCFPIKGQGTVMHVYSFSMHN
jgi:hypothetical protein